MIEAEPLSIWSHVAAFTITALWAGVIVFVIGRAMIRHWRHDFGAHHRRGFDVGPPVTDSSAAGHGAASSRPGPESS